MSNVDDDQQQRTLPPRLAKAIGGIRVDVARLHGSWMGVAFDYELKGSYSVVENWHPQSTVDAVFYRLWAALGIIPLMVAYPLVVMGLATRFYARRLDRWSASLGVAGVVFVSTVVWGALTAVTYLSPVATEGLVAVAIASVVATVSSVLGLYATRRGGRVSTIVLGYPLGMTALFLPPVVASLYSPILASVVFPRSTTLAILLLDTVLQVGGIAEVIRASFELEGIAYVGMWFSLAVPLGWLLGGIVTLSEFIRPSTGDEDGVGTG